MNKYNVYYGEYPLKTWCEMILKKEIVLPEFQRNFCWSPDKILDLIIDINDDFFIPPVIIANAKVNEKVNNYIIDGQQRLASVLLFYLNILPKKFDKYILKKEKREAKENEEEIDEDDIDSVEWTLREIQDYIEEAINSVLQQKTNFDFQLIVTDDCSTDKTFEIVSKYIKEYPNKIIGTSIICSSKYKFLESYSIVNKGLFDFFYKIINN